MKTGALSKFGKSPKPSKQKAELGDLKERAEALALDAKSSATKKAYKKDCELFASWAKSEKLAYLPAKPETIALYITYLDGLGRAPATITRVLTAISQAHKLLNHPSPTINPQITEVLKGIKRTRGTAQRQARPLLAAELRKIIKACAPDVLGTRDKALLLVCWAAALRRSELVALDIDDIEDVEQGIVLKIRKSKGDQEGLGQKVAIPAIKNEFCPVKALYKWLKLAKIERGALFCAVGYAGKGVFFQDIDKNRRLGARSVSLIVKKYVKIIGGNPENYSAHSLRAGWTTSAAAIATPSHVLMKHTRHRSIKTMHGYIREGQLFTDNPLSLLLAT